MWCSVSIARVRHASAVLKIQLIAAPRPRAQRWKSPVLCGNFGSNLWAKDGEHAKRRGTSIFGAISSPASGRKRNEIRDQLKRKSIHGSTNLGSRFTK